MTWNLMETFSRNLCIFYIREIYIKFINYSYYTTYLNNTKWLKCKNWLQLLTGLERNILLLQYIAKLVIAIVLHFWGKCNKFALLEENCDKIVVLEKIFNNITISQIDCISFAISQINCSMIAMSEKLTKVSINCRKGTVHYEINAWTNLHENKFYVFFVRKWLANIKKNFENWNLYVK